ncbi:MAG: transketolase C-terminal domain-containing protein [Verrucomicrobiales bacterium]|nr:transketolase C-terminal domain-containing protein [Verrucomicrobiales bacterium]
MKERVLENLNLALSKLLEKDERVVVIGEDIVDPYGGAFKVTRGLSEKFPERILSTPISELGFTGFANGLALAGRRPIVEFMFGDFSLLAADQIINFAAKSVEMYGRTYAHSILFRCPVGGHRGYGATHSQSLQKHFIGVPGLDLFELSPLHDMNHRLPRILDSGRPSILFEQKTMYGQLRIQSSDLDNYFRVDHFGDHEDIARVRVDRGADVLILCPGGQFDACQKAARQLLFEHGVECEIRVPFSLYPVSDDLLEDAGSFSLVVTVEESTPGGTWGNEVAAKFGSNSDRSIQNKFLSITAVDSPIPSAHHLERQVLPVASKIELKIKDALQ